MILLFVCGFVSGVICVLVFQIYLFFRLSKVENNNVSRPHLAAYSIPTELKKLFLSPSGLEKLKEKESFLAANIALQFLYQETCDYKVVQRWVLRKLQMECNDLLARTVVGRLVRDIKIHDFNMGCQFPILRGIQVERVELSPDKNNFEEVAILVDIDYIGGMQVSLDLQLAFGGSAFLSVQLTKLAGRGRFQLSRNPYTHWSFTYLEEPVMDFKVSSTFQGRPIHHLVKLIENQFKRAVRKRHVFPAYKIRHKPFFVNPLLTATSDLSSFHQTELKGFLDVLVVSASRLNLTSVPNDAHSDIYCIISLGCKPLLHGKLTESLIRKVLHFQRKRDEPIGILFTNELDNDLLVKRVRVASVDPCSTGTRCGFMVNDVILSINQIPVISEKQASRLLSNAPGELVVLVERSQSQQNKFENTSKNQFNDFEVPMGHNNSGELQGSFIDEDGFIHISNNTHHDDGDKNKPVPQGTKSGEGPSLLPTDFAVPFVSNNDNILPHPAAISGLRMNRSHSENDLALSSSFNELPQQQQAADSCISLPKACLQRSCSETKLMSSPSKAAFDDSEMLKQESIVEQHRRVIFGSNPVVKFTFERIEDGSQCELAQDSLLSPDLNDFSLVPPLSTSSSTTTFLVPRQQAPAVSSCIQNTSTVQTSSFGKCPSLDSNNDSVPDGDQTLAAATNRRQRIKAKATEVASKTTFKVKNFMQKHRKQDSTNAAAPSTALDGAAGLGLSLKNESSAYQEGSVPSRRNGYNLVVPGVEESRAADDLSSSSLPSSKSMEFRSRGAESLDELTKGLLRLRSMSDVSTRSGGGGGAENNLNHNKELLSSVAKSSVASAAEEVLSKISSASAASCSSNQCENAYVERKTRSVPLQENPQFNEEYCFSLGPDTKYLNIALWSKPRQSNRVVIVPDKGNAEVKDLSQSVMIAHTSLYLPEVLADCSMTMSHCHQEKYALRSSGSAVTPKNYKELEKHVGFDPRLCYGEIVLGFRWCEGPWKPLLQPRKTGGGSVLSSANADASASLIPNDDLDDDAGFKTADDDNFSLKNAGFHDWAPAHFESSTICQMCQKKIWMKNAFQCRLCLSICHRKCLGRSDMKQCSSAEQGVRKLSPDPDEVSPLNADEKLGAQKTAHMKRLYSGLTSGIHYLRRRKITNAGTPTVVGSENDVLDEPTANIAADFVDNNIASVANGSDNEDNGPSFILQQGNTYNEHIINAAKDLGKELFADLPLAQRRTKIDEQIDKLRLELDSACKQRLDIVYEERALPLQDVAARKDAKQRIQGMDEKIQALTVLMLHYCAGLQHCLDLQELEDAAGIPTTVTTFDSALGENSPTNAEDGEKETPSWDSLIQVEQTVE